MDFKDLTPEQQEKAKACKTAEDLLGLAKEEGYELSDADLDAVAGGASWYEDDCTEDDCETYTTGRPRGMKRRH